MRSIFLKKPTYIFALFTGVVSVAIGLALATAPASAKGPAALQKQAGTPTSAPLSLRDDYCLGCHGQPGQSMVLADGSTLELFVDASEHADSVHGEAGYACVQCHRDVGMYPHPAFSARDFRDVTLQLNAGCAFCHQGEANRAADSVHAQAIAAGRREAATCSDCHSAHAVRRITDPQSGQQLPETHRWIPQTCARCHNAIYQKYVTSVHGTALTEGNLDVPTCIDCHGVHDIGDPTTAAYRLQSPQICAGCHTDPQRMAKYGLTTEVLDTYVADFHGTTVAIFEKQSPDAETNKPVCYDCHGVHDILRTDDPQKGLQVRENLLVRCQVCHPNASADFPASWMSHYYPSPEKYPIVYYVDLFYKFFIPLVLGGMAVMVALDAGRRVRNRFPSKPGKPAIESPQSPPAGPAPGGQETNDKNGTNAKPAQADPPAQPPAKPPDAPALPGGDAPAPASDPDEEARHG
ncbi:MAG: cytochrome C [Chloroflexota bacterium]